MQKLIEIKLTTRFANGQQCVGRVPPNVNAHRKDVDLIRITNNEPAGTGSTITVKLDDDTLGNIFENAPEDPVDLDPGESLDLTVKGNITTSQTEGFTTIPNSCQHHDSGDIIIQP